MRIKHVFIVASLLFSQSVFAQLTLEQCQAGTRINYPLVRQLNLIEKSREYNLANADKAYWPQVSVSARVTYQSDVIDLTLNLPDPSGPVSFSQSKDQYQAVVEVNQLIWDGGASLAGKRIMGINADVEKQSVEVDLYALRDRVNQIYFALLLLSEQELQLSTLYNELQTNLERLIAAQSFGVVAKSDVDAFKVELLSVEQRLTNIRAADRSYRSVLSSLMGERVDNNTRLLRTDAALHPITTLEKRPEFVLLELKKQALDQQMQLDKVFLKPKLGLFLQGGLGRPGLNMLSNDFASFYIGGVKLIWNLSGFYTHKNNISITENSKMIVESLQETFQMNTRLEIERQLIEIEKLDSLLSSDEKIIQLRLSIKNAYESKLENGVVTASDLLREINAVSDSRQQKAVHELQRLLLIENINYLVNNE